MSYSLLPGSGRKWVPSWSCSQSVSKPVWHIPLLCVQWKTPDDGQRNCPKHVEFNSKNKFEKLVHLVGFIMRNNADNFSFPVHIWQILNLFALKCAKLKNLGNDVSLGRIIFVPAAKLGMRKAWLFESCCCKLSHWLAASECDILTKCVT